MKLYISGISPEITEGDLRELFTQFGSLTQVDLLKDPATGQNRGYAFVHFQDDVDGESAILGTNHTLLGGENIEVSVSRSRLDQKRERQLKGKKRPLHQNKPRRSFDNVTSVKEEVPYGNSKSYTPHAENPRGQFREHNYNRGGIRKGVDYGRKTNGPKASSTPMSFLGQENFAISPRTMDTEYPVEPGNSKPEGNYKKKPSYNGNRE